MKTLKEKIDVMQAFADGKAVECRIMGGPWRPATQSEDDITWNWSAYDYRIAEPPKPTQEDYIKGHRASGLKVGDKVRVVRKASSHEGGWACDWVDDDMDKAVGTVCTITNVDEDDLESGFQLEGKYWYPYFVLERVHDAPKRVEIQWPAGTTADDWERVTDQAYLPNKGDLKVWVKDGVTREIHRDDERLTVAEFEDPRIAGQVVHIYCRKRVPKMPDVPVWWVRTANRSFHSMPKIMNDGSGTTLGTWQQMQDAGCTWSPDRKRWFNFYGEEVK